MTEFGRRGTDVGKEDPHVILIRIDERLKNHLEVFKKHETDFADHKKEDNVNFKGLTITIARWSGIVIGVIFAINMFFKVVK